MIRVKLKKDIIITGETIDGNKIFASTWNMKDISKMNLVWGVMQSTMTNM